MNNNDALHPDELFSHLGELPSGQKQVYLTSESAQEHAILLIVVRWYCMY